MTWVKVGRWEFRLEDVVLLRHFVVNTQGDPDHGKGNLTVTLGCGESFEMNPAEREKFLANWEAFRSRATQGG